MADRDLAGPPPKEAVDYLRRQGVRPAFDYREVWREEHSHKCYTRFVTEAQYRRYVDQGIPEMVTGDGVPDRKPVKTEEPVLRPMQYRNKRTGEVHTGYVGIDYGFERNPGVGRAEQLGQVFERKLGALATDTVPVGTEVSSGLDVQITGKLGARVTHAIGAIEMVHEDGNLPTIPVRRNESILPGGVYNRDAVELRDWDWLPRPSIRRTRLTPDHAYAPGGMWPCSELDPWSSCRLRRRSNTVETQMLVGGRRPSQSSRGRAPYL